MTYYSLVLNNSTGTSVNTTLCDNLNSMTVSFWIKCNTPQPDYGTIIGTRSPTLGTDTGWYCRFPPASGVIDWGVVVSGGAGQTALNSSNIADNTWHNVVVTVDQVLSTSFNFQIYVDGVLSASSSPTLSNNDYSSGGSPVIVGNEVGPTHYYNGQLAEIIIWDRVLSSGEIASLATGIVPSSSIVNWAMTEGSGLVVHDISGNSDTLTFDTVSWSSDIPSHLMPPTVATPANATPMVVTGLTTALNVLGASVSFSESALTYTWSLTGFPPASVVYSSNGVNASKNSTVTFSKAGTYNFLATITDPNSQSVTSPVTVTVDQTLTSVQIIS